MIDFVKKKEYTKKDFLIQNNSEETETPAAKNDTGIDTSENETPEIGASVDESENSIENSEENPENSENTENSENFEETEDHQSNIEPFGFEVLKNGQSCGKITFDKLELKLGRTPENDIECLHPSTSRHHATIIIKESGVFIRDEGSTHGTFLNKKPLQGKVETQIKVGHFLKFGLSTRSFILTGPDSEREEEMKATWNELKLHKERTNRAKKMTKQQLDAFMSGEDVNSVEKKAKDEKDTEMKSKLHEVTWGFGEDEKSDKSSDEDEGEGIELGKNEDLKKAYYYTDPVKALNHFFAKEMQGATPTDMEKIGKNRWRVKIILPIDSEKTGKQLTAVAEGTPQSEAIREASLDACRMLDKAGVLRSDASTKKFITRDWKTNDYYDSDEDEFLDRTDQLQLKRERRKQKLGEIDPEFRKTLSKSYTYEEILDKLREISLGLYKIESEFKKDKDRRKGADDSDIDPLEAFMMHIKKGDAMTTGRRLQLRGEAAQFRKDKQHWYNLEKVARPHDVKKAPEFDGEELSGDKKEKEDAEKMKTLKNAFVEPKSEISESEGQTTVEIPKLCEHSVKIGQSSKNVEKPAETKSHDMITDEHIAVSENKTTETSNQPDKPKTEQFKQPIITPPKRKITPIRSLPKPKKLRIYDSSTTNQRFDAWIPPTNQDGDGSTDMNKKLGY